MRTRVPRAWRASLAATLALSVAGAVPTTAEGLTIRAVGPLHTTTLRFGGGYGAHPPAAEVPPAITGTPSTTGVRGYNVTTSYTYRCDRPAALFAVPRLDCRDRDEVRLRSFEEMHFAPSPTRSTAAGDMRRNYSGVFSAELLRARSGRRYLLYLKHAENKNAFVGTFPDTGALWDNTIDTIVGAGDPGSECAVGIPGWSGRTAAGAEIASSGFRADGYFECWGAYNGLVTASRVPFRAANDWGDRSLPTELGPIVWPTAGYLGASGEKTSFGVRHPSSLLDGGYVYVYYLDTSDGGTVRVARAPATGLGRPPSWRSWNGSCWCIHSTPPGLTAKNYRRFWATPLTAQGRGAPADVLPDAAAGSTVRFSVARFAPHGYVGVEEYVTAGGVCHVALRSSDDRLDWSPRTRDVAASPCSARQAFDYPVFLDAAGWSNDRVELSGFYLVGAHAGRVFTRRVVASP